MTLTEALDTLHRAGRIASPWLPGMLATDERRFVEWADRGTAAWLWVAEDGCEWFAPGDRDPDTTDPATVGCLAALAREASGVRLYAVPIEEPHAWYIGRQDGGVIEWGDDAPTEGEAWAAVLVVLAGGTP